MIEQILTNINVPYRETRFAKVPSDAPVFAVYDRRVRRQGGDMNPAYKLTEATIYLYGRLPEDLDEAEACLEVELDNIWDKLTSDGWERFPRTWIDDVNVFCTIYSFTYKHKR